MYIGLAETWPSDAQECTYKPFISARESNKAKSGTATGYVKDSTGKGNYSGSLAITGSNTAYQQKHIYDMAGNVDEWTMEASSTYDRVSRGGHSVNGGSGGPASGRIINYPDYSSYNIGFRLALYVQ